MAFDNLIAVANRLIDANGSRFSLVKRELDKNQAMPWRTTVDEQSQNVNGVTFPRPFGRSNLTESNLTDFDFTIYLRADGSLKPEVGDKLLSGLETFNIEQVTTFNPNNDKDIIHVIGATK